MNGCSEFVYDRVLRSVESSINVIVTRELLCECFRQHVDVVHTNAEKKNWKCLKDCCADHDAERTETSVTLDKTSNELLFGSLPCKTECHNKAQKYREHAKEAECHF